MRVLLSRFCLSLFARAPKTSAALVALTALVATAHAQRQFAELGKLGLPADRDSTRAVTIGDVDGDGDLDVLVGNSLQQNRLYLDDGSGTYTDVTAVRLPADTDDTRAVAMGDVDGDGDLDLVLGNYRLPGILGQSRLYLNDGSGSFADATATHMPAGNFVTTAVVLGDVDGDGDLDLVLATWGPQNRLYLNDGTGVFADVTAAQMPFDRDLTQAAALADVDGDGDLDLLFANTDNFFAQGWPNSLYLNDGAGAFSDATAARLPALSDLSTAVAVGDVDGDGDLDLVFGNTGQQNRLHLNDGAGFFVDVTAAYMPARRDQTNAVAFGDVDADGDLDLVFANGYFATLEAGHQNRLYLNDGSGAYTDATAARMPADRDYSVALAVADTDADGDADLVFANQSLQNRLYLNEGDGTFRDANGGRMPFDDGQTHAAGLGDVDGDGDVDMVLGNARERTRLYLNDGAGGFDDATVGRMPVDADQTWDLALADVDRDGDLDLVLANRGDQNRLYLNDGTGAFADVTAVRMPADGHNTLAVAVGDVDGDGDLDLVFANGTIPGQQNRLYLNDGSGTFVDVTAVRLPQRLDDSNEVLLGDVDGDGDLDLFFANGSQQNRLYLNDGSGRYADVTLAQLPVDSDDTRTAGLGDVDGDGDLDLVLGNFRQQNRLYLNSGGGVYTDATAGRLPTDADITQTVALGDVDGDGDLDVVLANGEVPPQQNRLYLNDGTGVFDDGTAQRLPADSDSSYTVALGDVDRDGDLDAVFGNRNQNRLYLNLLRQLDAPRLLRVGQPYTLDGYARYGPPSSYLVQPFLATATASIPVSPFGTFLLDPSQTVVLPPFAIPQPAGVVSIGFVVPNAPGLTGLLLYGQGLVAPLPVPGRLTNLTTDVISR